MDSGRRDAATNRVALLRAALDLLCERAGAPSLESVARRAGVGRSTAYRHFPDQRALVRAVALGTLRTLREVVAGGLPLRDVLRVVLWLRITLQPLVAPVESLPAADRRCLQQELTEAVAPAFHPDPGAAEFIELALRLSAGGGHGDQVGCLDQVTWQLIDVVVEGWLDRRHGARPKPRTMASTVNEATRSPVSVYTAHSAWVMPSPANVERW
jgi:AcrR family transcriptional regulator